MVLGSHVFCVTCSHTSSINLHSPTQPFSLTLNFTCINLSSCTKARFCFKLSWGTRLPHQAGGTKVDFKQSMKCLMLFAPHGTLSPLSDLFAAPGAIFKGQMFPSKHKIGWELFAQKSGRFNKTSGRHFCFVAFAT